MKLREISRLVKNGATFAIVAYVTYRIAMAIPSRTEVIVIKLVREEDIEESEKPVLEVLKEVGPGVVHIGESGRTIYGLTHNAQGVPLLLTITGPDFNDMSSNQIDAFVKKTLGEVLGEEV